MALRNHCIALRLLRVTPRPRAWQRMLATSFERNVKEEEEGGREHGYTTSKQMVNLRNQG